MNRFKYLVYLSVLAALSAANAGSYDDFFIAAKNDNASQVGNLLKQGFDPNTRDAKGQTGLNIAMIEHSPKVAKLLLEQPGTDVNALNNAGESALMLAAIKGDMASAQWLLDRGARVNQPGWAPLHYAATGPEPRLVRLLLEHGAEIDAPSPNGTTPLMMAAQYGSEDNVKILLDKGADPNLRNQKELRAVDFAKLSGRAPLVKALEQLQR